MAQSKLNGFVFVDVLLFAIYLNEDTFNPKELHEDVVYNVIFYMTKSTQIDGHIEDKEMRLLLYLLQSSNLEEARIKELESYIKNTNKENFEIKYPPRLLHRKFIFELCVYLNYGTHQVKPEEDRKLRAIGKQLKLSQEEKLRNLLFLAELSFLKNRSNLSIINQDKTLSVFFKKYSK